MYASRSDLEPDSRQTGVHGFIRFDLSTKANLLDVWGYLLLQIQCEFEPNAAGRYEYSIALPYVGW